MDYWIKKYYRYSKYRVIPTTELWLCSWGLRAHYLNEPFLWHFQGAHSNGCSCYLASSTLRSCCITIYKSARGRGGGYSSFGSPMGLTASTSIRSRFYSTRLNTSATKRCLRRGALLELVIILYHSVNLRQNPNPNRRTYCTSVLSCNTSTDASLDYLWTYSCLVRGEILWDYRKIVLDLFILRRKSTLQLP